eukprot:TRINITY_DN9483_c0_g2_i2.p1 TRINITY_DN9483_c0_g2~~TRINITY_DN9483_c0_g2_i2.p1  ORF type:complete len:271 (+),score=46.68 TRINITY_DN9483_c0_g2_i2:104-916(+)
MGKKGKRVKGSSSTATKKPKRTTSYAPDLSVLVLGDGDFSFANGLLDHRRSAKQLLATSYDSHATTLEKYSSSEAALTRLNAAGVSVLHEVDACHLDKTFDLAKHAFDRIVFNFPHAGKQRVHVNRHLIEEFLASAAVMLKRPRGEVHLTLKLKPPYSNWGSEQAAAEAGLCHVDTLDFDSTQFPGYRHQTTLKDAKKLDIASDKAAKACKTLVFRLTPALAELPDPRTFPNMTALKPKIKRKRKRARQTKSSKGVSDQGASKEQQAANS